MYWTHDLIIKFLESHIAYTHDKLEIARMAMGKHKGYTAIGATLLHGTHEITFNNVTDFDQAKKVFKRQIDAESICRLMSIRQVIAIVAAQVLRLYLVIKLVVYLSFEN